MCRLLIALKNCREGEKHLKSSYFLLVLVQPTAEAVIFYLDNAINRVSLFHVSTKYLLPFFEEFHLTRKITFFHFLKIANENAGSASFLLLCYCGLYRQLTLDSLL